MFESTLEAQGLNDAEKRVASLSVAALAHVGIGLAIVSIAALIVPPVKTPEPSDFVVTMIRGPVLDLPEPKRPAPAPIKGTESPNSGKMLAPPKSAPPTPPESTADTVPTIAEEPAPPGVEGPSEGGPGDPRGSEIGIPGGRGTGHAGPGDGPPGDPAYVTGEMVRPVLQVKVEPAYPEVARRASLGGRVTVQAVIGLDGDVESAEVFASTNPLFNKAALDAVRKWRYSPAAMNGRPVRVYFTVVVDFLVR